MLILTPRTLQKCGAVKCVEAAVREWLVTMFVGRLPDDAVLRVADAFMNEGPKVLVRMVISMLKCLKPALCACHDATEVRIPGPGSPPTTPHRCLLQVAVALSPASIAKLDTARLFRTAYGLQRFGRSDMEKAMKRLEAVHAGDAPQELLLPWYRAPSRLFLRFRECYHVLCPTGTTQNCCTRQRSSTHSRSRGWWTICLILGCRIGSSSTPPTSMDVR